MSQSEFKIKSTIYTAIALFIFDAFVMNQGAIAAITIFIIFLWLLPKSVFLKYKNKSPKVLLTKALIYGVMALAVFSANFVNNKLAKYRAEKLIVAIEAFHQSTGSYPEKLTDLVPGYIPAVPMAKYTLIFNKYWYIKDKDNASLFYVALPPFGRPTYSFTRQSWSYLD